MNDWKTHLAVLGLFVALTFLMTYPLILNPVTKVRSMGDTLLNSWIIAWDVHKISNLDLKGFFNANIFYPYKRTLAYSEHLFPQALLALPVLVVSHNPLFAYNVVFLFAFVSSGFGMYLLARYLTRSTIAAVTAGIIYAYSPFMVAHEVHLQILTAGGIPLAFLFLHKFFERERLRDASLFGLFYLLQGLANGYYFLYLTFFSGIFILYFAISRKKYRDGRFLAKLALVAVIVAALASPFLYPYIQIRKEMGFLRKKVSSAKITSFLATNRLNRIYGAASNRFLIAEGELFPGFIPFGLAVLGLVFCLGKKKSADNDSGIETQERGKDFLRKGKALSGAGERRSPRIYLAIWILAFSFVFGLKGPYYVLYKLIPGFDGLRAGARWNIFIMFSLAIFAALGMCGIMRRLKGFKKKTVTAGIPFLILLEYLSIPMPVYKLPVKKDIPEVYRWLAEKKGEDFALVELPFPEENKSIAVIECPRMYYSTYHWKRLVNGYSGYFAPFYMRLKKEWSQTTPALNIARLKEIGVRYILFHSDLYHPGTLKRLKKRLALLPNDVLFVARIGQADIYELVYPPGERDRIFASPPIPLPANKPAPARKKQRSLPFPESGLILTKPLTWPNS